MEETIKRALRLFLKNDYWREYYETAPDDLCRRYIELEFADSVTDIPEISEARRAMYDKLELQDWIHLEKYAGNNPFRSRCRSMIEKLTVCYYQKDMIESKAETGNSDTGPHNRE